AAVRSPVRSRFCIFASFVARQKKARGSEGNIRMNYALDPTDNQVKILNEDHYYPFGLKHTNYNSNVKNFQEDPGFSTLRIIQVPSEGNTYRYKYQEQEWQDELGLNWYSFKWRNYDPSIGRFFNIDKLAQDYVYNSPYAFCENKVVSGREIEGLEYSTSTSSDGKTVTVTAKVSLVNKSNGIISNKEMRMLAEDRAANLNSTVGGKDLSGRQIVMKVEFDPKATLIWEYNTALDVSKTVLGPNETLEQLQVVASTAAGWTDDIGNTQKNRTQINLNGIPDGMSEKGIFRMWNKTVRNETARTGNHEDGHNLGQRHQDDALLSQEKAQIQLCDPDNLFNRQAEGSNVTPQQRTDIINQINSQQSNVKP
ncbi:hypothetical protein HUK80_17845, partial [Flavobacterium sp. MAH-1]